MYFPVSANASCSAGRRLTLWPAAQVAAGVDEHGRYRKTFENIEVLPGASAG
jgi:hypothetical protein